MITEEKLRSTYHRIEDLKIVRAEKWKRWHVLNDLEQRTKDEGKEMQQVSSTITSLTYEIRGLQIAFKEMSEQFILQVVGG
ncbi:hypothetical protein SEPL_530 [Salmonella phage SE_PL]|uniref:hypothetical protein n=1 Tax=Salmonella enterica TaxID=28901 RepID=UPI000FDF9DFD|nr:hypothetical protein CPT_Munch_430 [Salmonella phage Munch]EAZ2022712.1 hypothetical protein [Salmonella enterica]ECV9083846.1 hypothetical protein [Salmonella enterica subsp. enterica serovar Infantis]MCP0435558.1 hypothetical protein [Salmonella enterica subsp. enterica serovar Mbandaka]QCW18537.1 hypothetical protein 7t3_04 [Salmonella phage 7t3]QIG63143.1 hypothetical protein SEPL_530 [Salmonella phage SE_PL]